MIEDMFTHELREAAEPETECVHEEPSFYDDPDQPSLL